MVCRVCLLGVKKNAVICEQCSLISHSKCSVNAPPTCDLRAQLLSYAQYAEKGNPGSAYSNPSDILNNMIPTSPASDVSYVAHTRTSIDNPPPTAFKFIAAFRRSNYNPSPEPSHPASTSLPTPSAMPREGERRPGLLRRRDRPQSIASNNTSLNTSSTRSAATAAESFSSPVSTETGTRRSGSRFSAAGDSEGFRSRQITERSEALDHVQQKEKSPESIPGGMPPESPQKKHNKDSKSGACTVQ